MIISLTRTQIEYHACKLIIRSKESYIIIPHYTAQSSDNEAVKFYKQQLAQTEDRESGQGQSDKSVRQYDADLQNP